MITPERSQRIEDAVLELISALGDDPDRAGIQETPARVARAWKTWAGGYGQDPSEVLKCFEDGAEGCDSMVLQRDIPFYSMCEHHLAPFFGTVDIAYIPSDRIVGLSKLSRLTDIFARRLQVQERLTNQIAQALYDNLEPLGVGVVVRARHLCMESRGVQRIGTETTTSSLLGAMRDDPTVRGEFLSLISKR